MNYFNLHTHSNFCDGKGDPEEYVSEAIAKGFHTIGFSSHAPVPFENNFAIKNKEELRKYCNTIRDLSKEYKDRISIYLALEIDFIDGITDDFIALKKTCGLDYCIGSVHLVRNASKDGLWFIDGPKRESYDQGLKQVFDGDIRLGITAYYDQVKKMLLTQQPDILGHFDKIKMHNHDRYFHEDESWYRDLIKDLLEVILKTGVIVEVNTRGIYKKRCDDLYPGVWILKEMRKKNIPITLSADAHHPSEIDGYYKEAIEILNGVGYRSLICFRDGKWVDVIL